MCPTEGDFLPPITDLPARPSTMPPPPVMGAVVPPSFVDQATNGADVPAGGSGQGDNMDLPPGVDPVNGSVTPVEQPRRGGRRRRSQAELLQGAPGVATAPPPPVGQPLQQPSAPMPPPIFDSPDTASPPPTLMPPDTALPTPGYPAAQPAVHVTASSNGASVSASDEIPEFMPSFTASQLAEPRFWVGLGTTVNIGNFENIKYDTGISGVPVSASEEQLRGLATGVNARVTFLMDMLGERLVERVAEIRGNRGE